MSKTTEALKLAEAYIAGMKWSEEADEALAAIREVLAEPEITTPDVCGEVCARAKLCYGCGKAFDEALADHVEQEPVKLIEETKMKPIAYLVDGELRVEAEYSGKIYFSEKPLYDEVDVRQDERTKLMSIELTDDDILEADKHSHGNTEWVKKKAFSHALINAFKHKNAAPVQPVKQEPVIWHSVLDFADVRRDPPEQGDEANWLPLYAIPEQTINQTPAAYVEYYDEGLKRKPLYAEPVDAKAIRADALEEAAKMAEAYVARSIGIEMAAAIRCLK
jgi:hypothetical protein